MIAAYEKLLSHKTAIQITTNEPQSCVFCEGGKTFLYKIHPVSFNGFKSLITETENAGTLNLLGTCIYLAEMEGFELLIVRITRTNR